jgi:hypothetical protein
MTIKAPRFATIPPQIHHQKTTFCRPFLPKPQQKRINHREKNKDPTEFYRVFDCKFECGGEVILYWLKFGSSSSSMP